MRRIAGLLMVSGLMAWGAGTPANAASFDCAQAVTPDEVAICRNAALSKLDTEMGALWLAYSKLRLPSGAASVRQESARDFLRRRSSCGDDVSCLRRIYRNRIAALKGSLAQAQHVRLRPYLGPGPVRSPYFNPPNWPGAN